MTNHKSFETFDEITNDLLRAWNRAETVVNVTTKCGDKEADKYFDQFNDEDKMKIKILLMAGSVHGREAVLKKVQETVDDGI